MTAANPVTLPLSAYKAKHVRFEVAGKVATLTLDRPDKKNPLTFDSYAELREAVQRHARSGDGETFVEPSPPVAASASSSR